MSRGTDYDLNLLRSDYLADELDLEQFEHAVGEVVAGHRIHEHDWIDITTVGPLGSHRLCSKCGQEKSR